ncbi:MAG: hypothetical protein R3F14_29870 [Polyangiaceae bacterium]
MNGTTASVSPSHAPESSAQLDHEPPPRRRSGLSRRSETTPRAASARPSRAPRTSANGGSRSRTISARGARRMRARAKSRNGSALAVESHRPEASSIIGHSEARTPWLAARSTQVATRSTSAGRTASATSAPNRASAR